MAHGINDHVPAAAGFSADQFGELVRLLTPIHALAIKVLEQMPEASEVPADEPPSIEGLSATPEAAGERERSESERGSG